MNKAFSIFWTSFRPGMRCEGIFIFLDILQARCKAVAVCCPLSEICVMFVSCHNLSSSVCPASSLCRQSGFCGHFRGHFGTPLLPHTAPVIDKTRRQHCNTTEPRETRQISYQGVNELDKTAGCFSPLFRLFNCLKTTEAAVGFIFVAEVPR